MVETKGHFDESLVSPAAFASRSASRYVQLATYAQSAETSSDRQGPAQLRAGPFCVQAHRDPRRDRADEYRGPRGHRPRGCWPTAIEPSRASLSRDLWRTDRTADARESHEPSNASRGCVPRRRSARLVGVCGELSRCRRPGRHEKRRGRSKRVARAHVRVLVRARYRTGASDGKVRRTRR